jgi:hypothetical protein
MSLYRAFQTEVTVDQVKKIALDDLRVMLRAVRGKINKVYLHWSAGHYSQFFSDYHLLIDSDGSLYVTVSDLSTYLPATYMRNSGSIALAALCAYAAHSCDNLGAEPPTKAQIECIAQVMALCAQELGLSMDINHFLTHSEAGDNLDGENPGYESNGCPDGIYGPSPLPDGSPGGDTERWDFWAVEVGDSPWSGGEILRGKAAWYIQNGIEGVVDGS